MYKESNKQSKLQSHLLRKYMKTINYNNVCFHHKELNFFYTRYYYRLLPSLLIFKAIILQFSFHVEMMNKAL
jgi:hypothetical protein